jgi:hypothetical protein
MRKAVSLVTVIGLSCGASLPAVAAPGRPLVRFLDVDTAFSANLNGSTTMTTTWAEPMDPDSGWLTDAVQVDWPNGDKKALFARAHGWDGFYPHMLLAWPNFHVRQDFRTLLAPSAAASAELDRGEGPAAMADLSVGIAWALVIAAAAAAGAGPSLKVPWEVMGPVAGGLFLAHIVPGWILPPMFESQTRQQIGKAVAIWNDGK